MRFHRKWFWAAAALTALLPARANPVEFDLPGQPAAAALIAFAQQANVEILFSSDDLKRARATTVTGTYEPDAAIALLLNGTGFRATRDARGKFVVTASHDEVPIAERIVELPPLTVSASLNEAPWNYLEIPGFEILSRCKLVSVVRWAKEIERLQQWLGVMLPDELRVKSAVPTGVILYDVDNKPVLSAEVVADMLRANNSADGKKITYRSLPNMRLADKDAMDFFFILDPAIFGAVDKDITGESTVILADNTAGNGAKLTLKSEHVHYLARNRTPALPIWFVDGVVDLFNTADFNSSVVAIDPLVWLSSAETEKIKKNPDRRVALLPLADLFSPVPGAADRMALRRAEAVLFIRWGLDGKNQPRRDALWKFLKIASTGPVTEARFKDCFGFGYSSAQEKLSDYLSSAVSHSLRLTPKETIELPPLSPRRATDLEVARIKGDWDRLEINYVKSRYPQLTPRYVEQARRTLHRAYDNGERDPRLLAVMGLCECDADNDAGARPYLEAAVKAGVVRPRANYELARLRYAEARTRTILPNGMLSAAQASEVLQPLADAYRQQPPLIETYALTAEVWTHSALPLTRQDLDLLGEGVGFFPWNAPLVYQAAWLNAQHGFKAEAAALIAQGLKITATPALVTRFEQLRATLAAPSAH